MGGLRSCGRCDSCSCAPKREKLAISLARGVYEWGNTREGGEAGDGDVCGDFFRLRHCSESVLESGEVDLL